jgi:transcriptional regulator
VCHVYGPLRIDEDLDRLRALVRRLTDHHEHARPEPWSLDDAPADFVDTLLGAIVGIEIPISRMIGKWKLSQNRPETDRLSVIEALTGETGPAAAALAETMKSREADS